MQIKTTMRSVHIKGSGPHHKEQQPVLTGQGREGKYLHLLWWECNCSNPLDDNTDSTQKTRNWAPMWRSNSTSKNIPEGPKNCRKEICTPIFIAALLATTKIWKQSTCPRTDDWIKKLCFIYIMDYYLGLSKYELMRFAVTGMYLESIMLSKMSQKERNTD